MQAALVALPGALDVVRAAMAQHPDQADVVLQGQAVLDAAKAAQAAAAAAISPSPPAGVVAVPPAQVR
jgi:hypothetical protein